MTIATDLLKSHGAFAGLEASEAAYVADKAVYLTPGEADPVISQGDLILRVYFVLAGGCRLLRAPGRGQSGLIVRVQGGGQFGELAVIAESGAWDVSVMAERDTALLALEAFDYRWMIDNSAAFRKDQMRLIARAALHLGERTSELVALDLSRRLRAALLRLAYEMGTPRGDQVVIEDAPTHDYLAQLIGSRREVVTRELHALAKDGLISLRRGEITVLSLARLQF